MASFFLIPLLCIKKTIFLSISPNAAPCLHFTSSSNISNSGFEKEDALSSKIQDLEEKEALLFFAPLLTLIFPLIDVLDFSELKSLHF